MRHLSLVVPVADLEATTRRIARIGVLHLLDVHRSIETAGAIRPYDQSQRSAQIEGIERILDGVLRFLAVEPATLADVAASPAGAAVDLQGVEARTAALAAEVDALRRQHVQAAGEAERLENVMRSLRAFLPVGVPLEDLQRLRYLYLTSGLLPERNLARLRDSLPPLPHLITPAGRRAPEGRVMITALCLRTDQEVLDRALRSAQFERVELPRHVSGTPELALSQLEAQMASARQELARIDAERQALAQRLGPEAQALQLRVQHERLLVEAQALMGRSEHVAFMSGWVPAMLAAHLERGVRAATAGRCALQWRDPAAVEDVRRGHVPVPILLHNPVLIRPFERLLRAYGLPRYGEIEPTAVVAVAFLTMFGFMFGDIGQGAVLFGIGYFIYRRMFRYRDYAVILMECGVFATLFGFLYGSVFGVEDWLPPLWLRPMENIPTLMQTALIFGAGFLSLGMGLNLVNAFRRRDLSALWQRNGLLAALAYWIAVGLFIRRLTAGPGAVTIGTVVLLLAPPATLIFLKEPVRAIAKALREHTRIEPAEVFALFVEALVDVLDTVVSTISNTATFIRLAAFALSHAGLFLATFSVADAVSRSGGGTLGTILVIAAGNVVIISLEGLIVAIQSIRLEYYEFFSKFYSGGGEEYRPLRFTSAQAATP